MTATHGGRGMTVEVITPQALATVTPGQREAAVTAYLESALDRLSLALEAHPARMRLPR